MIIQRIYGSKRSFRTPVDEQTQHLFVYRMPNHVCSLHCFVSSPGFAVASATFLSQFRLLEPGRWSVECCDRIGDDAPGWQPCFAQRHKTSQELFSPRRKNLKFESIVVSYTPAPPWRASTLTSSPSSSAPRTAPVVALP